MAFGELTVKTSLNACDDGKSQWLCECSCGTVVAVRSCNLKRGLSTSCGCKKYKPNLLNRTHGQVGTKAYIAWANMIQRCTNPKVRNYNQYGGRGITVCDSWKAFENFYSDMGQPPEGLTLERKHNDSGYSKENCIWATRSAQALNRRMPESPLKAQAISLGISLKTLKLRIKYGKV